MDVYQPCLYVRYGEFLVYGDGTSIYGSSWEDRSMVNCD